jgi:hypothetical protein
LIPFIARDDDDIETAQICRFQSDSFRPVGTDADYLRVPFEFDSIPVPPSGEIY